MNIIIKIFLLALILLQSLYASVYAEKKVSALEIEVLLFYNYTGRISEDIFTKEAFTFRNVIIGGGGNEEEGPSESIIVKIKFSGPKGDYLEDKIIFTVISEESDKTIYQEEFKSFLFNQDGVVYKAVMIRGHNCETLTLSVDGLIKKVPFYCNE